ncbi:MAG: hypothetical protein NT068_00345 [Candidatus Nomurabacteria bacterium]|nr:hypothetical protein [Candidatus Nomurabacteria bacterium]
MPSKKIQVIVIACIGVLIIFIFFLKSATKSNFLAEKKQLEIQNSTINDLIAKDTDGDGVPDWEEALWGTDKNKTTTFEGITDKTYIENKKKDLNITNSTSNTESLTETEKFSRDFFTAFMAMKTGQVDNTAINSFSAALGQKVANPNIIDQYTQKDVKIDKSGNATKEANYYMDIQSSFEYYQLAGLGDELDIVSNTIATAPNTESKDQNEQLLKISEAYKGFATKIMTLEVPEKLVTYHLKIANSANNTGISVGNMSKIVSDPVIGLSGLSQYQKYSDDLINAAKELESTLPNSNAIIESVNQNSTPSKGI